jgi:mannose-6-phosphate isomerase-like protein (cupin superfamily)
VRISEREFGGSPSQGRGFSRFLVELRDRRLRVQYEMPDDAKETDMIRSGQTIENPVTGDVLIFHRTSRDTGGESVLVETVLRPGATVAAAHVHPCQSESFRVLEGRVGMKVARKKLDLAAGEEVSVLPGTAHKFWNAGDGPARFTCEIRPAGAFEQLIETMFGLAADGKTSKKGMPSPLRLAVIARHHFDDVRLPVIPHATQRIALAMGAPVGRALGYRETYEPAGDVAVA